MKRPLNDCSQNPAQIPKESIGTRRGRNEPFIDVFHEAFVTGFTSEAEARVLATFPFEERVGSGDTWTPKIAWSVIFTSVHFSPLFAGSINRVTLRCDLRSLVGEEPRNFDRFHESSTTDGSRDSGSSPQTEFLSCYSHHRVDNAKVIDNGARPGIADGALCLAVYRISG